MELELVVLGISLIITIFVAVYGTIDVLIQTSKIEDQEEPTDGKSEND